MYIYNIYDYFTLTLCYIFVGHDLRCTHPNWTSTVQTVSFYSHYDV